VLSPQQEQAPDGEIKYSSSLIMMKLSNIPQIKLKICQNYLNEFIKEQGKIFAASMINVYEINMLILY